MPPRGSNSSRKVRIIATIRGYTDQESGSISENSLPLISVYKHGEGGSDEKVTLSFGEQPACRKNAYDMDYCYGQNEDSSLIFVKEIKPLISGVMNGKNASIIAFGARGSGKTCTIQGSEDKPGLAALAMAEILSAVEENGNLIAVSVYEVYQDNVLDVLDANKKVQLFENAHGYTELRGISQVRINSMSEFVKLYYNNGTRKATEKVGPKIARRSHKGLMICVLSDSGNPNSKVVGKMNFVDLAGYEDARRNSIDCANPVETANINKSLYALLNVVYALNTNESRVPYRESKLSRVLQDSFGGSSRVLLLTCLNPVCQDTMYTVSLASRSLQGTNGLSDTMIRSSVSLAKPVQSSMKNQKLPILSDATNKKVGSTTIMRSSKSLTKQTQSSVKNQKPATVSATSKKGKESQSRFHKKIVAKSGRKLFDDGVPSTTHKEAKLAVDCSSAISLNEAVGVASSPKKKEETIEDSSLKIMDSTEILEKENLLAPAYHALEDKENSLAPACNTSEEVASPLISDIDFKALSPLEEESDIIKEENNNSQILEKSPPLSSQLRELSNSMKSLYSSTPSVIATQDISNPFSRLSVLEPQTPQTPLTSSLQNPREIFNNRSSGMKQSLVKDCLQFLNTASKDELKGLKGIGEKRATYILELREESPEPFKNLDDLQDIGLSAKQVKGIMRNVAGDLFN
ncbi:kinesin-like protein KIN-10C isoform X1 [Daucus carota subsp. sativus]|uniref:kinesin-like protein KIN-10C isoform X1 n=1 Tax=Daucus carota subsp. sativus TaxID=79200 RepID=UPI0007EFA151|nr:PREDICTED: kinesin-like protein KIF22 isoform X1 [Daucus carota subsp. sativus]